MGEKLRGEKDYRFIAVEPASCPSLTRGKFAYDFCDTGMKDWIKTGKPSSFQFDTPYDFICMTIPFAELKAQNGMKPLRRGADYSFLLH